MRRLEFLLPLFLLSAVAFSTPPRSAVTRAGGVHRDAGLHRQLQLLQVEVDDLRQVRSIAAHSARLDAIVAQLRQIEVWDRHLDSDHPDRTAAQLRLHLGLLTVELERLRADFGKTLGLRLQRRAMVPRSGEQMPESLLNGTGTLSGTVTDSDTTLGIAGVLVSISHTDGDWAADVFTDGSGDYTSPPLAAGDYVVNTLDLTGYINELYNDIPCYFACDLTGGDPVLVTASSDTPGIDFELAPGGRISGTVTDADSHLGVELILVDLFDTDGNWLTNPITDSAGGYLSPGLPEGDYRAATYNWSHYVDELYDDLDCPFGCDVTIGDPIQVVVGATSTGIDFELRLGGSVAGNVKVDPSGTALEDVAADIFDSLGDFVTTGWTDSSGDYVSERGLPAGLYYAKTVNQLGYVDELFDDITCPTWCEVTAGDGIVVTLGETTTGIDFSLTAGGWISGTVTAEGTETPLAGIWVDIFDAAGNHVANGHTDGQGSYRAYSSLPAGTYHAKTWNDVGYVDELYDDLSCPSWCDLTSGDAILVVAGATTSGIDFQLDLGGRISGTVTASGTGVHLEGIFLDLFTPVGDWISNPSTDETGEYMSSALPPGTYYARTWNDQGYIDELYDDIPCSGCLVTAGTPIVLIGGTTLDNVDIDLQEGGRISGTVTEEGSSLPVENIHVEIWSSSGQLVAWAPSDAAGDYAIPMALPAGIYFAKTWNDLGYINELYDDAPCAVCIATQGSPLVLAPGATISGIDFSLSEGGRISGVVTDENTDQGLQNIAVLVLDLAGDSIQSTRTDNTGGYLVEVGLPTGSYYLRTNNGQGYVNEAYDDLICLGDCDLGPATAVLVQAGVTTDDIDFALARGATISGAVTDATSAHAISDSEVALYDSSGSFAAIARVRDDGTYTTRAALPPGVYYATTRNFAGYYDELFSEVSCLGGADFCDVTQGTPILVAGTSNVSGIDFTLDLGGWFEGSVLDEALARAMAGVDIHIFDSGGSPVTTVTWLRPLPASGSFKTCGLPPGTYYAQTDSSALIQDFADELFDDVVCAETCDVLLGTPISVVNEAGTVGIDFRLRFKLFANGFEAGDTGSWSRIVE